MARLEFDGTFLRFQPPESKTPEVKEVLGGRWDSGRWKLAPTSLNVLKLVEWYGDEVLEGADESIRDLALEPWGFKRFSDEELADAQTHPHWDELYDHQREGVEFTFCNPHAAALLGLSWGLGKAATSIVSLDLMGAKKVLVLAPLSLAPAWLDEVSRWSAGPAPAHRSTAAHREPAPEGWTIANHEVIQEVVLRDEDGEVFQPDWARNARKVKEWIQEGPKRENQKGKLEPVRQRIVRVRRDYLEAGWDAIVVDESVLLKNRKAVKLDVLGELRKEGDPIVLELSASPTTKFRNDLYGQMKTLYPRAFSSYWRFAEFFCVVDKSGWGWTIEGDNPDHDPQHYLRDLLWVKSEDDAGLDLPDYIEYPLEVDATEKQQRALDQMLEEWIVDLEEEPGETVVAQNWLSRSTRLQQITSNLGTLPKPSGNGFFAPSSAKLDLLLELLERGDLKPPLLVWTWFVESTELVAETLAKKTDLTVAKVHGKMTTAKKDAGIAAYKDGEVDALVLQMGVGKFGHTFTHTQGIYYHDRTFDSDAYVQSRRRVRRIGLEHRPTLVVPKVKGSADDLIDANLEGKLESIAKLTNANLAELLRSLRED